MCKDNETRSCDCIADILHVIKVLQDNAERIDSGLETCDKGFLGDKVCSLICNTRPITLYKCDGTLWNMPITRDNVLCSDPCSPCSSVFRIEKLDGCCATFRVLADNPECGKKKVPYVTTNSFFTINLNCVCAIKCLQDTFVDCI